MLVIDYTCMFYDSMGGEIVEERSRQFVVVLGKAKKQRD